MNKRMIVLLSILSLSLSLPLIPANANYSSVAAALSAGDVSAAARLMNSNRSISPSAERTIAIANALSTGNIARASEIINGPAPTPQGNTTVATQRSIAINALTSGDINGVAIAVFGQDAAVAISISRGDIASAVSAINQSKKINQDLLASTSGSQGSSVPSTSGSQGSSVPSTSGSQGSSVPQLQSLTIQATELSEIKNSMDTLKKAIRAQIVGQNRIIDIRLKNLNSLDKQKFLNSEIYKYFTQFSNSIMLSDESITEILEMKKDQNWYNSVRFSLIYEVQKISFANSELLNIRNSIESQIPKNQCLNSKTKLFRPLSDSGKCKKGLKKVLVK
jgi:hypothetical protein